MDFAQRILCSQISFVPAKSIANNSNNNNSNYNNHNGNSNNNNNHHHHHNNNINLNNNHNNNNINNNNGNNNTNNTNNTNGNHPNESHQLSDPKLVQLDWLRAEKVGCGLTNVGNTCFLNSVLQCLTYCPPLYNFLLGHSTSCKINLFCMLCEMEKHVKRIRAQTGGSFKPTSIVQRLKYINRNFQYGRQEDAHEFLRYIIDHMWKACLLNHDITGKMSKIDPKVKETTVINHIFGGYHRSQVLCLSCNSRSNTFDFFMDFILDIRNAKSLEDALKKFTQSEVLENENAYKCSKCRKKVTARKKFTVYKAPNVATFQLKRFDSDKIFGGKVTKFVSYPDELDLRPYMSDTNNSPIRYKLSAVLVHVGHSSNSGHYFCFVKNSNNFWYRMDDSNVTLVPQNTVLEQQAYVLFYIRKTSDQSPVGTSISTWMGSKSKLEETAKSEMSERDKFNEELDKGKVKTIKPRAPVFSSSYNKPNPFQRAYQQFQNGNGNGNGYSRHHQFKSNFRRDDSHKKRFRHGAKHKSRSFNGSRMNK